MSWEFIIMAIVVVIGMAFAFVAGMYTEWLADRDSREDFLHAESAAFKELMDKNDKAIKLNTDVLQAFTEAVHELAKEGDDNVGGD